MIDGVSNPAFSMETIEPQAVENLDRATIVRAQSRRCYAQPRESVQRQVIAALVTV